MSEPSSAPPHGPAAEPALIPARARPPSPRRAAWRVWLWQALLLGLLALLIGWLAHNTRVNLAERGIRSGWDFLGQTAGFDIGERLIAYESSDSYARALAVGVLNTLRVALLGIVGCTLLGALIGVGRFSDNLLLRGLCRGYVELFRNVPLLVQLLVWYLLLVEGLPDEVRHGPAGLLLGKAGLVLPWLAHDAALGWHWSRPVLDGFAIEGGLLLSPEFVALLLGLVCYTAAYVAEVVRAGIAAVPRGQIEAAESLGLSRWQTLRRVSAPLALRVIVPPLANQYLNLSKNSSLAVAVGYPDLVSIANTTLNQTGRAVECIAILMLVYLALSLLTAALMHHFNQRVALRGQHAAA
jgi:general L-amino acid transport system permease protein